MTIEGQGTSGMKRNNHTCLMSEFSFAFPHVSLLIATSVKNLQEVFNCHFQRAFEARQCKQASQQVEESSQACLSSREPHGGGFIIQSIPQHQ